MKTLKKPFLVTSISLFYTIASLFPIASIAQGNIVAVTNYSDIVNGDTTSIPNLIAFDGGDGISLREAMKPFSCSTKDCGMKMKNAQSKSIANAESQGGALAMLNAKSTTKVAAPRIIHQSSSLLR